MGARSFGHANESFNESARNRWKENINREVFATLRQTLWNADQEICHRYGCWLLMTVTYWKCMNTFENLFQTLKKKLGFVGMSRYSLHIRHSHTLNENQPNADTIWSNLHGISDSSTCACCVEPIAYIQPHRVHCAIHDLPRIREFLF